MKIETAKALIGWEGGDDTEIFSEVSGPNQVSKSRWTERLSMVYQNKEDGSFWEVLYLRGLTESQDLDEDDMDVKVRQVFPRQVTKTVYLPEE